MTIRERLNAIRDRADDTPDCACSVCLSARDAAAALRDLASSALVIEMDGIDEDDQRRYRLVPDPVAAATPDPPSGT